MTRITWCPSCFREEKVERENFFLEEKGWLCQGVEYLSVSLPQIQHFLVSAILCRSSAGWSPGGRARTRYHRQEMGVVLPLEALPRKEPPHPNQQGPRWCLPAKPVVPGMCGHLVLQLQCPGTWDVLTSPTLWLSPVQVQQGQRRTKHNSSGQELSVNLRSSNSHSQPVTFRKPFQVLLHSESLFLAVFLAWLEEADFTQKFSGRGGKKIPSLSVRYS